MAEDFGETTSVDYDYDSPVEEKKDNKIWIIVAVVLVVLCCCCLVVGGGLWWFWNNGDQILDLGAQSIYPLL
ncbi:MAG: hypothetical protein MUO62_10190 [Anaerolineales bacterium]|nr:hypothetical protein [Anaerolineales bacterium]